MRRYKKNMFDFTEAMERLIGHIIVSCPEFAHVRMDQTVVSILHTRSPGAHGIYASVQPLRFEGGERTTKRRGRTYVMPEVRAGGAEVLYIMYFAVPRFLNLDFQTKIITIFHELYHIDPGFNGDIRRFPGKNYAHGHSRKRYNERMQAFVEEYLSIPEAEEHTAFLHRSFDELVEAYGGVVGTRVKPPRPKLA